MPCCQCQLLLTKSVEFSSLFVPQKEPTVMPSNQGERHNSERDALLARREVMRELKALDGISDKAFQRGEEAFSRLLAKLDARIAEVAR